MAKPPTFAVLILKRTMANHKSAEKRIRANEAKRVRNRYQHKTTRTAVKKLKTTTVKSEAEALLKEVTAMIDKLAKKNIIHWKKAANQKSQLAKMVNKLA
jgi:small subunit ribosomal protein S20